MALDALANHHILTADPPVLASGRGTTGMEYQILGTTMPVAVCALEPGETVYSESGAMAWMTGTVKMEATGRGTGVLGALGRMMMRESLFLVEYTADPRGGLVAFGSPTLGQIVPVKLGPGESIIAQKSAFLAAEKTVQLQMHFKKQIGAGLFGGEGFIMQRVTGPGVAFLAFDGEIVSYQLDPGEVLKVDTGYVAAHEPTVSMDVELAGGIKNMLFGGEGLFLTALRGPGRVWLQTLPAANLAQALRPHLAVAGGSGGGRNGLASSLLGGLSQ